MNPSVELIAFVGSYGKPDGSGGGVHVLKVDAQGRSMVRTSHCASPVEAGYLLYDAASATLYAVDERKTDGRGPVQPPAAVHALRVDQADAHLSPLGHLRAPGPRPTFLAHSPSHHLLFSANHGDFQHVEKVVRGVDGRWSSHFVYDDSTVVVYGLADNGALTDIEDVLLLAGHGLDPNTSPQNGGHAQASAHAHCAVVSPDEKHLLVCDKGTDQVYVYALGPTPELLSTVQFGQQTAPRHVAFSSPTRAYMTLELSSEVVSLELSADRGELTELARCSTMAEGFAGLNEPAEVRVHPNGRFVYVNNRGEDSLAWFAVQADASLRRLGAVQLAKSIHPGLAARSFAFAPQGEFMLVADRPANRVLAYQVDPQHGGLTLLSDIEVADPAYIEFAELPRPRAGQ